MGEGEKIVHQGGERERKSLQHSSSSSAPISCLLLLLFFGFSWSADGGGCARRRRRLTQNSSFLQELRLIPAQPSGKYIHLPSSFLSQFWAQVTQNLCILPSVRLISGKAFREKDSLAMHSLPQNSPYATKNLTKTRGPRKENQKE